MTQFVEAILPLPLYSTFTYRVPTSLENSIKIGSRILVPFGRKKYYTAIVSSIHNNKPEGYEVKEIMDVMDEYPIIRYPQLKLWNWIADYYLCSLGEVYKAAIPTGLKVESETFVTANPDFEESETTGLKEKELVTLSYIASRDKVQISDIEKSTGFKNVESIVTRLLDKDAVFVSERAVANYRPKTETFVELTVEKGNDEGIHKIFELVKQAKKQETLLLAFLDLSHWLRQNDTKEVTKKELLTHSNISSAVFSAMVTKGIFRVVRKEINRFQTPTLKTISPPTLTEAQQKAYWEILDSFKTHNISLLHGVTSSGKTEIYINLISEMMRQGKQSLFLVPEIALTTQLTTRLKKVFGDNLLIYHSKFSDNERVDIWKRLLNNTDPCVVIGVRSSVFLPFSNLGLVVVDEEHETSYKQYDPAPRYNGRNVAMVLALMHNAKTLLGSATPSLETYYNATNSKFGLITLSERYEGMQMPDVEIIDVKQARKRKEYDGIFSKKLKDDCSQELKEGNQVILFQNRRGYAPMAVCKDCGWIPKCENCDVSLTYHKYTNTLSCHYCGFSYQFPTICKACGQPSMEIVGFGTERIEDEIEKIFPENDVLRMDLDTTRNKNSYDRIIEDFSNRKAQVLIGTQMISKGLDFDGVSLVGVLNADTLINFPDFRSSERAFNMLEQVAGRAGRKNKKGLVEIQTSDPENPILNYVKAHDYLGFYNNEIEERKNFRYPPFTKIINVYLKHRDDNVVTELSVRYSNMLREIFSTRVLGPEAPLVGRVQQFYIRQIVLKMENEASMAKVKKILRSVYENLLNIDSRTKSLIVYYDVDPV